LVVRPPRIEQAGGVFHVVARGNERALVFRDDRDRERFLEILGGVAGRYRWRVLAYCLMGNHFHLLVMTLEPTLARGMRQLKGVYAQWFNRRHRRVGHLFQGRYKAVTVQTTRICCALFAT
jgi:putative transposase